MSPEQLILLIIAIIGAIILVLRFTREKPRLNVEVLSCKHRVRSDHKTTNLKLQFRIHNSGDKGTTLTKLAVSLYDWNGNPHTATENLKIDVDGRKSTDTLEVLYTFSPTFQYGEWLSCTFTLHHTEGSLVFKANSQESSEDLSRRGFFFKA